MPDQCPVSQGIPNEWAEGRTAKQVIHQSRTSIITLSDSSERYRHRSLSIAARRSVSFPSCLRKRPSVYLQAVTCEHTLSVPPFDVRLRQFGVLIPGAFLKHYENF